MIRLVQALSRHDKPGYQYHKKGSSEFQAGSMMYQRTDAHLAINLSRKEI
jgi:hypothetical protein